MESINKVFMLYLKKHFDKKEEYEPILSLVYDIENNHKQFCKKIQNIIMVSEGPINPSFQKIIMSKIKSSCRPLKTIRPKF